MQAERPRYLHDLVAEVARRINMSLPEGLDELDGKGLMDKLAYDDSLRNKVDYTTKWIPVNEYLVRMKEAVQEKLKSMPQERVRSIKELSLWDALYNPASGEFRILKSWADDGDRISGDGIDHGSSTSFDDERLNEEEWYRICDTANIAPAGPADAEELASKNLPDIENLRRMLNETIPAKLEEGRVYEIRYDKARLRENSQLSLDKESPAEALLIEYVNLLRMRTPHGVDPKEAVKLIDHPDSESLFSVKCYEDKSKNKVVGESHVNVEGDIRGQPLRIIAMLNIAVAASHIPNGTPVERLSDYGALVSYIKNQYKGITGRELDPRNLWYIVLPRTAPIPLEKVVEYYRLTIIQLEEAA